MIYDATNHSEVGYSYPPTSIVEAGTTSRSQISALNPHKVVTAATCPDDDIAFMQELGYFGFPSLADAVAYTQDPNPDRDNAVILLQTKRNNTCPDVLTLTIPTRGSGLLMCTLAPHPTHEKNFREFYKQQAEEEAALERLARTGSVMNAAKVIVGTDHKIYVGDNEPCSDHQNNIGTQPDVSKVGKLFGEWWLAQGGKFRVIDDPSVIASQYPEYGNSALETIDFDLDSGDFTAYLEPTSTDILNIDEDVELAQLLASTGNSGEIIKNGKSRPGLYKARRQPLGALRVWQNMGLRIRPVMASQEKPEHPVYSHAPPVSVDIRLLGDIYITTHELLTFFPGHIAYWRDYVYRLGAANWSNAETVVFIYMVRGQLAYTNQVAGMVHRDQSRFQKFRVSVGLNHGDEVPFFNDLTCTQWVDPRPDNTLGSILSTQLIDYYVSALAEGVPPENFPTGDNAGPLTDLIRHLQANPDLPECRTLTLRGASEFTKRLGIFRTSAQAGLDTTNVAPLLHANKTARRSVIGLIQELRKYVPFTAAGYNQ